MSRPITRAIVPAAGWGTRLRPLTNAIPKEMLPLGRRPVLEYVLTELRACGIEQVLFIVSAGKEAIRKYFAHGDEFGLRCDYVEQREMRGLGDAVLHAEDWSQGEHFVVAFGDCIIEPAAAPPLQRVLDTHALRDSIATVLAESIPRERSRSYGILAPAENDPITAQPFELAGVVEKPDPIDAPSAFAVAARWVLSPVVFEALRQTKPARNGELNLTDAIHGMIRSGSRSWAVPLLPGERRLDIGGWETYLSAAASYALKDHEFGPQVRAAACQGDPQS